MGDTVRPDFVEVARMIGDEALAPTLAGYAWVVGIKVEDRETDPTPRQIYKAAETLSRALPWYNLFCRAQIDVTATLATLEAIKTDPHLAVAIINRWGVVDRWMPNVTCVPALSCGCGSKCMAR